MHVLIVAAGTGRRMKSYGVKSLIQIGNETILARQIRLVKEMYPKAKVTIVAGFESERVRRAAAAASARVVVNDEYEETNVGRSIAIGLAKCPRRASVLVIYGDLVFEKEVIQGLDKRSSAVIVSGTEKGENRLEVGSTIVDNEISVMSYGLSNRWTQIMLLAPAERALYEEIAAEKTRTRQMTHEILNEVIERGGKLRAIAVKTEKLFDVDSSKEIQAAKRHLGKKP